MQIPAIFWLIGIGMVVIGFGMLIALTFVFRAVDTTGWRWIIVLQFLPIGLFGFLIIGSFITGTTWKITSALTGIPPTIGILEVSDVDILAYHDRVQQVTNLFLESGRLPFDDVSGLSYVDRFGNAKIGALDQAEQRSLFIIVPLLIIWFLASNIFLWKRTFNI